MIRPSPRERRARADVRRARIDRSRSSSFEQIHARSRDDVAIIRRKDVFFDFVLERSRSRSLRASYRRARSSMRGDVDTPGKNDDASRAARAERDDDADDDDDDDVLVVRDDDTPVVAEAEAFQTTGSPSSSARRASVDDVTDADDTKNNGGRGTYKPEFTIKSYMRRAAADALEDEASTGATLGPKRRCSAHGSELEIEDARREPTKEIPICGLRVKFPAKMNPHPAQRMTMVKIIDALTKSQHAMIESPTGTGKTLALLCSTLGWLEREKEEYSKNDSNRREKYAAWGSAREKYELALQRARRRGKDESAIKAECRDGWDASRSFPMASDAPRPPRVYVCSRTHSQLEQILRELKRTGYAPTYTVLSSRQRLCPLKKSDADCQDMLGTLERQQSQATACAHYNRHEQVSKHMNKYAAKKLAWDMEDFNRVIDEFKGCPFFALRHMNESAEVIFCPYNYLFDHNVRRKMKLDVSGAAVIIDEGHNIEDVCRSGTSIELSLAQISEGVKVMHDSGLAFDPGPMSLPYRFLHKIMLFLERIIGNTGEAQKEVVVRSHEVIGCIIDMLGDDALDLVGSILERSEHRSTQVGPLAVQLNLADDIASILDLLSRTPESYVIIIGRNVDVNGEECPGMCISCMEPKVGFSTVAHHARCVILTSGTLSPMGTFQAELGVEFPIKIEAPHVVPTSQVYVELSDAIGEVTYKATSGVGATRFARNLGNYLLQYAKVIPGGMLVFFPKYSLIDVTLREWHLNGLFGQISDYKHIVCESRGAAGFADTLAEFNRGNDTGKGSLMFAVFRGKVSEGIDFKDDSARAVFCVGIPFPNVVDVKVKTKRDFNDLPKSRQKGMLTGSAWYSAQAYRAYNQALGRCIRHPKDYAALFLVDARFREGGQYMMNNISKWIRKSVTACGSVNESVRNVDEFFKRTKKILREREVVQAESAGAEETQNPESHDAHRNENIFNAIGCEDNRALCDAMDELHQAALSCEDPVRVNAIAKAVTSIRALTSKVTSGSKLAKAGPDKVQGVGTSIGEQIDYFLEHNKFERMEYYLRGERMPQ